MTTQNKAQHTPTPEEIKKALDEIKKRYETGPYKIIKIETSN